MGPFSQCLLYRPQEGGSWAADPETFFMETQRYPRHSARPWRRPSSSWITGGTGPPGVRWTPARRTCAGSKSRTVTSCSGLVSFLLETWTPPDPQASAPPAPGCAAPQRIGGGPTDSFSPRRSSGVLPGRTGGHFRRPPVSPCGLLPSPWHSRALKGRRGPNPQIGPRAPPIWAPYHLPPLERFWHVLSP